MKASNDMHPETAANIRSANTRADKALVAFCLLCLGVALGVNSANALSSSTISRPDWTLMPCEMWAGDTTPQLPPYTVENACVADDGSISAVDTLGNTVTIEPTSIPAIQQITKNTKN